MADFKATASRRPGGAQAQRQGSRELPAGAGHRRMRRSGRGRGGLGGAAHARRARSCSISSGAGTRRWLPSRLCGRAAWRSWEAARLLQARAAGERRDRCPGTRVVALPADASLDSATAIVFADPRISELGNRAIISDDYSSTVGERWRRGLPGAADSRSAFPTATRISVRAMLFPHEANLDQLGGVSFSKGCYVGQEVVSRMEHRGTARSRILPVAWRWAPGQRERHRGRQGARSARLLSTADRPGAWRCIRLDRLAEALAAARTAQGRRGLGHGREAGLGAVRGAGRCRGLIVTRRADGAQCTKP